MSHIADVLNPNPTAVVCHNCLRPTKAVIGAGKSTASDGIPTPHFCSRECRLSTELRLEGRPRVRKPHYVPVNEAATEKSLDSLKIEDFKACNFDQSNAMFEYDLGMFFYEKS
mmetsp:Transcript_26505/g.66427  ORF Transcript_26505/g.66427 Transcript_26505/m.66427 type:complete len:113 (-) Transcript_26505:29-367(-)